MSTIQIQNLTHYYKTTKALNNINLTIEEDKIYGLLGRNGAGKTTLLNLITNKLFPTEGDIQIDNETVFENDKVLRHVFYMTQENLYPENLKVQEVFKYTKEFYPEFDIEYAKQLSNKFQLNIKKKIKELSTGYNSIFKAIVALASNAKIVIYDEPVLGLDANHRDLLYKELISNYMDKPKTIILSTHLIEEVSELLEDVIIIKNGEIVLEQTVEELLESAYTVAGEASKVDEYVANKKIIGTETMASYKCVTVFENVKYKNKELASKLGLDYGKVELQKLFINVTNS